MTNPTPLTATEYQSARAVIQQIDVALAALHALRQELVTALARDDRRLHATLTGHGGAGG